MKQHLLSLAFILFSSIIYAQIGIGTTSPDPSSILDIQSTTKGILAPRINLNNVSNSTIDGTNTNAAGLLIYNTNASVTGGSGVGYYYWDGSVWTAMKAAASGGSSAGWQLEGNSVTSGDFLGTTNDDDLRIRTNDVERFNFTTEGQLLYTNGGIEIGTAATSGSDASTAIAIGQSATASSGYTVSIGVGASASGSNATAIGNNAQANNFPSSAFGYEAQANAYQATAIGGQARANSNGATALGVGAQANNTNTTAIGAGTIAPNANTLILGNGVNVGIGTNNPQAHLHVTNSFRYVDGNEGEGKVLTSDAEGNASWEAPESSGSTANKEIQILADDYNQNSSYSQSYVLDLEAYPSTKSVFIFRRTNSDFSRVRLRGIKGGTDGRTVTLMKHTDQFEFLVYNNDSQVDAENRFNIRSNYQPSQERYISITFIYDGSTERWVLLNRVDY
ncbi:MULTISPECIES: hypothetical protein [Leeuwenhoekiella]|uniref:hypothetical protein n=1 Tax=Leeuwenhoekiella TaxID=283735 RepID=UPI000C49E7F0|nr:MULTISPECIES: hypothetical protein [Leeuwenhoekiella]MAO45336.1 hypothetical protein [Leeuwenhoekiella sp.]|tara:strand:+ start:1544 stop:2890 length:1347 start_codon:yes stop_codon:yes gene_type:complete